MKKIIDKRMFGYYNVNTKTNTRSSGRGFIRDGLTGKTTKARRLSKGGIVMEKSLGTYGRPGRNYDLQILDGGAACIDEGTDSHYGPRKSLPADRKADTQKRNRHCLPDHQSDGESREQPLKGKARPESRFMAIAIKRRIRRRKIQRFVIALLVTAAFFTGFFGRTLFDSYAKESRARSLNRYYTSIQIEPGDNLWKIASRYAEGSEYTVAEYVEELKRMNGLRDGQVHSGEYLTVVYFSE